MKGRLAFLDRWYESTKELARHPRAFPGLCALSFAESSFFPIPVDLMLMPMVQASPEKWWRLALWASLFSVLGGIFGYFIGLMFFETIALPILEMLGKTEKMEMFRDSINEHGAGIVRLLGKQAEQWMKDHFAIFTVGLFALLIALYMTYRHFFGH